MRESDTARGRVLPTSRWIALALVGTIVLALSGSALAETPGGSSATQVRVVYTRREKNILPTGCPYVGQIGYDLLPYVDHLQVTSSAVMRGWARCAY